MDIALSFELLVPLIALIAAIKGFNVARKHEHQSCIRLLSYGLVLIAISYLIPFSSVLAIKLGLDNYESLGIIGDAAYLFSILIIVIGFILIAVAIFKFREKVFIIMKNGNEYYFMRDSLVDIDSFKKILKKKGVKVI